MSAAGVIMDAVLAEVGDAIEGVVTKRAEEPWDLVTDPLYSQAYQPAVTTERLEMANQEKRTTSFFLDIVTRKKTEEEMLAYLDALQTEIAGNRTLTAIVDWCWISEWVESAILEGDEDTLGRRALVLTISSELIV